MLEKMIPETQEMEEILLSGKPFEAYVFAIKDSEFYTKSENLMNIVRKIKQGFYIVAEQKDSVGCVTYLILGGNLIQDRYEPKEAYELRDENAN